MHVKASMCLISAARVRFTSRTPQEIRAALECPFGRSARRLRLRLVIADDYDLMALCALGQHHAILESADSTQEQVKTTYTATLRMISVARCMLKAVARRHLHSRDPNHSG